MKNSLATAVCLVFLATFAIVADSTYAEERANQSVHVTCDPLALDPEPFGCCYDGQQVTYFNDCDPAEGSIQVNWNGAGNVVINPEQSLAFNCTNGADGADVTWNPPSRGPADTSESGEADCVPAASEWGLVVITLLILVAGTVILNHRRRVPADA